MEAQCRDSALGRPAHSRASIGAQNCLVGSGGVGVAEALETGGER